MNFRTSLSLLTIIILILLVWLLGFTDNFFPNFANYLNKYQTLITGILAFAAAIFTIDHMRSTEENSRKNKNRAVRTLLSHTLSDTDTYIQKTIACLLEIHPVNYGESKGKEGYYSEKVKLDNLPNVEFISEKILQSFSNAIEFSDPKSEIGNYIAKLVGELQVHNSRMKELEERKNQKNRTVFVNDIDNLLYEAIELNAMNRDLYPYARLETEGLSHEDKNNLSSLALVVLKIPQELTELYLRLDKNKKD